MRPYLRVANVFEDRIDTSDLKVMDFSGVFERYKLEPGDVLLNEGQSPEFLGRPAIYRGLPEDVAFTNTLLRFRAGPDVLPEWALVVFRRHMHFQRFAREARITTNIAHLSASRLKPIEFPVPPLDEQRRIVDTLEDHLSHLDAADTELSHADMRLSAFRTSAVTSELLASGGEHCTLLGVSRSFRNGIFVSRAKSVPNGVPILRIGAVRPLSLDLTDLRYSERGVRDLASDDALLAGGDLLFTRYNGNPRFVGACAVVPHDVGDLTYPDKLIRVQIRTELADPAFIALACSFGDGRQQIQSKVKTTSGQSGISGADLKRVSIRLPPLQAQLQVLDCVREQLSRAFRTQDSVNKAKGRSAGLRRALLEAAFTGRLTGRARDLDRVEEMAGV
jgi:type I restriction enzyme S subunit